GRWRSSRTCCAGSSRTRRRLPRGSSRASRVRVAAAAGARRARGAEGGRAAEAAVVSRVFTGGLRQGALAGLMVDAIAKAAGVPADLARRALMLSGDLSRTAELALTEGADALRGVGLELFRPVLPMLASTTETVTMALTSFGRASVEWKLDGI